jgi:molybdopterin-guanine dinucleotide biosynthesis protein A
MLNPSVINESSGITGVILAGGKSSRMGCDKALLDLEGKPFICRIAETLQQSVESVVIISNSLDRYKFLGLSVFSDVYEDCGPLGGIHSSLIHATTEKVFVISCDMPLISADAIHFIIDQDTDNTKITVPMVMNILQPLCGVYKRSCLPDLVQYLVNGHRSVQEFVMGGNAKVVPMNYELSFYHPLLFADINTMHEYQKIVSGLHLNIGH